MKQEILQHVIDEQEKVIANLQEAEARDEELADYETDTSVDIDDKSQQDQSTDMANFYEEEMEDNSDTIATLKQNLDYSTDKVELGALVETSVGYFFIGTAFPPTNYKGKQVMGVSLDSPVYDENKNKKAGEELTARSRKVVIDKIY